MIISIILFVTIVPVILAMYFILRNEAKPKKNIILGVTLPLSAREDAAVADICAGYKKHLLIWSIILSVLPVGIFFIKYSSVVMTVFMFWIIIVLCATYGVYVYFHLKLKKEKVSRGWEVENPSVKLVDTTAVQFAQKKVSAWWFVLPVIVSVVPIIFVLVDVIKGVPDSAWPLFLYVTDTLLVALFYGIYFASRRQRADIIDGNTDLTIALTRVRRYNIDKILVVGAISTALFSLGMWLFMDSFWGLMITTGIYTAAIIYIAIQAEFAVRKAQQTLTQKSGEGTYVDEDKKWIFGMFYHNPDDRHFMVHKRVGTGMTVNMARPAAKVLTAILVLIIAALPVLGFWVMHEEFTPLRLELTENQIVAYHTRESYAVDFTDIQSAELLTELPKATKINGTNFDTLYKGVFTVDGIGRCYLNINPQTSAFILIKTSGKTYIFNCSDANETVQIFDELIIIIDTINSGIQPYLSVAA